MKLFSFFALVLSLSLTNFAGAEEAVTECTKKCKLALFDAEFEFDYHSGASSNSITEAIVTACGEVQNDCAKILKEEDGSIRYLIYAGCIHETTKKDCKNRYDQVRSTRF